MNTNDDMDLAFHALAHQTRRRILDLVRDKPGQGVGELAKAFDVSRIAIMNHLKVLEETGIVRSIKKGRVRTCHIEAAPLIEAQGWLAWQREIWEGRLDRLDALAQHISKMEKD